MISTAVRSIRPHIPFLLLVVTALDFATVS